MYVGYIRIYVCKYVYMYVRIVCVCVCVWID
jgi:hypothetical protein